MTLTGDAAKKFMDQVRARVEQENAAKDPLTGDALHTDMRNWVMKHVAPKADGHAHGPIAIGHELGHVMGLPCSRRTSSLPRE